MGVLGAVRRLFWMRVMRSITRARAHMVAVETLEGS